MIRKKGSLCNNRGEKGERVWSRGENGHGTKGGKRRMKRSFGNEGSKFSRENQRALAQTREK